MRGAMAILEGVLAIHKPPSISSYDVIRTVTPLFRKSQLFQPLIARERSRKEQSSSRRKNAQKDQLSELKIGHGGTLDPLATGVLVVGIGNGTKALQKFLDGTKEYECTVLFGAATDSYDILGKVTKTASWEKVTKERLEEALETLKGDQMQLPPVYSAIRVDGKHLYEYARQGLPIPEIKRRPVTVHELELLEWLPPDQHSFELPSQEADAEAKLVAERATWPKSLMNKRKRESDNDEESKSQEPPQKVVRSSSPSEQTNEAEVESTDLKPTGQADAAVATAATQNKPDQISSKSRPPAARIRMVVSSGFYVRSLCHDLGVALDSAGLMATLVRSRQSGFELGRNVIEFDDFEKGEEVWEPQVKKMLEEWQAKHAQDDVDNKRGAKRERENRNGDGGGGNGGGKRSKRNRWKDTQHQSNQKNNRRNTSSPEPEPEPSARRRRNTSSPE
ncbi:tRNA pseudouridine(55) synthase [Verruconis gallopava]|uniref:tRNA pseudouridine(55) synthase n=1 Tax=Verruconis gallopava TaxID=253628 RepID=A0A0D1XMR2_9PEZI|nr:tRNA pseudouridine(55) synthase [Verruconis gallopava]KIW03856.1 tRNA pseudouridine(55) synthase [Verruconis gallopava]